MGLGYSRSNVTCHGDEIFLLFKSCEIPSKMDGYYTDTDREVGETLLEYWTNFVKNGKPSNLWQNFNSKSMQRLEIDSLGEVSLELLSENSLVKSWLTIYEENPPKIKKSPPISKGVWQNKKDVLLSIVTKNSSEACRKPLEKLKENI